MMQENVDVMTEIVGVSATSIDHAVTTAIERARQTLSALQWFEVKEIRGTITDGKIEQYQVTLDVGFRYLTDDQLRSWAQS
jgi:dodecin